LASLNDGGTAAAVPSLGLSRVSHSTD